MTIREALRQVDELKPNAISEEQKIKWLDRMERFFIEECIKTHHVPERYRNLEYRGYDTHTDDETELLIPDPDSEVYLAYLEMKIDLANMEIEKYNNSAMLYGQVLQNLKKKYNRECLPLQSQLHF